MANSTRGNKVVPDGWRLVRLGDVGRFINGRAFKPTEWGEIGLPIVRIQNLTNPDAPFNRFNGPANADNLIDTGDIVVSWSATIEARTWVGGLAILNQHIFKAIEQLGVVDRRFFFFLLVAAVDELRKRVHGTTMQHVTRGSFESLPILLPPLPEQRVIAEVLDSIDEAIEATETVVAATEQPARRPAPPAADSRSPRLALGVERRPRYRHNPRLLGSGSPGGSP